MTSNVQTYVPPPPPGPATFDRSKFRNGGTLLLDTQTLTVNANLVNTCRVKVYGDPSNPLAPAVAAPSIATNFLFAPYFDAANTVQFSPALVVANDMVQVTKPAVFANVTVGQPFSWTPPTFSTIVPSQPRLSGTTFGQSYPLSGGQLRGYATLYVPQPPISQKGLLLNLNGGTVAGNGIVYR